MFLSEVLWAERIGLLPVDDRWFTIYFAQLPIASFDSHELRVVARRKPKASTWTRQEKGRFPLLLHLFPSTLNRRKCQGCARSNMSGMSPAVQLVRHKLEKTVNRWLVVCG